MAWIAGTMIWMLHMWRFDISTPITYHIGYYLHYNPLTRSDEYWLDYGDCRGFPNACLEMDAQQRVWPGDDRHQSSVSVAMYYFGVFNANQGRPGVPPISQTGALVRLYDNTGLVKWYEISPIVEEIKSSGMSSRSMVRPGRLPIENCIIDYSQTTIPHLAAMPLRTASLKKQTAAA